MLAHAATSQRVAIDDAWDLSRVHAEETGDGIRLTFPHDAIITRSIHLPMRADTLIVDAIAEGSSTDAMFLWHSTKLPEGTFVQLPFSISRTGSSTIIPLGMFSQWDSTSNAIGLAFPQGSVVRVRSVTFEGRGFFERVWTMARSFWTFDEFKASSVNFLWGPILTLSPLHRAHLFENTPPIGWSAHRILLPLFCLSALIITAVLLCLGRQWKSALYLGVGYSAACIWLILDLRMGIEILSYAAHDWTTYVRRPLAERQLRGSQDFYALLALSAPHIKGKERIGYIGPRGVSVGEHLTYFAYPAQVSTVLPPPPDIDTWLVFHRPDATVDENGLFSIGGDTALMQGTVLTRTSRGSFVFRRTL